MNDQIYTLKESASLLRVHIQTLYRLIKSGDIKSLSITEGRKGILSSELERYIESRKAL